MCLEFDDGFFVIPEAGFFLMLEDSTLQLEPVGGKPAQPLDYLIDAAPPYENALNHGQNLWFNGLMGFSASGNHWFNLFMA